MTIPKSLSRWFFLPLLFLCISCGENIPKDVINRVDPFIGTDDHGHTFPGPTVPFGMVQLSPDTGIEGWDWCSGYHSSDESIMGFSHTHLSGTGGADYGDILFMPTMGELKWEAGSKEDPDAGYRSRFSHDKELASPGYYAVQLMDYNIKAELSSTNRVGIHKYTYKTAGDGNILIDLKHGISDRPKEAFIKVIDNKHIEGLRRSTGWANDQWLYFAAEFSKPFKSYSLKNEEKVVDQSEKQIEGVEVKANFDFDVIAGDEILVKVALSSVSAENAWKNMEDEAPNFHFDGYVKKAEDKWRTQLSRIEAEGGTLDQQKTFYTALYHAMIAPNTFSDVNGEYRGMDKNIHKTDATHPQYTVFSLWDTYRATHPLFTIINPNVNQSFIHTMLRMYEQHKLLPVWELAANETGTMIGYHSTSVIADAWMKGQITFDKDLAYEAMKTSAMQDRLGIGYWRRLGYIPSDKENNSVSKVLEYAFNDWIIAQAAKDLGKQDDYEYLITRSLNYKNSFDPETTFMRGRKSDGTWSMDPFDPWATSHLGSGDYTEGNAWQYSMYVPQDVNGLIHLFGSDEAFVQKLDDQFNAGSDLTGHAPPDVSGLIGQYAQGNEPSHHVAYLYAYAGQPYKTQQRVRQIMDEMYHSGRAGLCGNEDCGQMSAWYILSAMGFYPVAPGSNDYIIGSPIFDKVTIHLQGGKKFVITSSNNDSENVYIESASLNGKPLHQSYFTHQTLEEGGELHFNMSSKPNKEWASAKEHRPVSLATTEDIHHIPLKDLVFKPYSNQTLNSFDESIQLELKTVSENADILYTLNGKDPIRYGKKYTGPVTVDKSAELVALTVRDENGKKIYSNEALTETYSKAYFRADSTQKYPIVEFEKDFANNYNPDKNLIIDGFRSPAPFRSGHWFGTLEANSITVDLGSVKNVSKVSLGVLEDNGASIFFPEQIKVEISNDGKSYSTVATKNYTAPDSQKEVQIQHPSFKVNKKAKYVKLSFTPMSNLPDWHYNKGGTGWTFIDEIVIEK